MCHLPSRSISSTSSFVANRRQTSLVGRPAPRNFQIFGGGSGKSQATLTVLFFSAARTPPTSYHLPTALSPCSGRGDMSFVLRTPVAAACGMSCTRTSGAVWFALVDKLEPPVLPRCCVCLFTRLWPRHPLLRSTCHAAAPSRVT